MKRLTPYLLTALVLLAASWWSHRVAGERAVAIQLAEQQQARADSAAALAQEAALEAAKLKEGTRVLTEAVRAARRETGRTTAALSTFMDSALVAARDSTVRADSLRRLLIVADGKVRAALKAQAAADSALDAERLRLGERIAAEHAAALAWEQAYRDEVVAHALTKAIPEKSLIQRATPYLLVGGVSWLAGKLDVP